MTPSYSPKTLVSSVVGRLAQRLPINTGVSLKDTRNDEVYRSSRDALLGVAGKHGMFDEVLHGVVQELRKLNVDYSVPIEDQPLFSQESILVLTQIVAQMAIIEWESLHASEGIEVVGPLGDPRDTAYLFEGRSKFYSLKPRPTHVSLARDILAMLIQIKSSKRLATLQHRCSTFAYPVSDVRVHRSTIDEIDTCCDILYGYLSASNWDEVYDILMTTLKTLKTASPEESDLVRGMDILGCLFLDSTRILQLVRDLGPLYPHIRRIVHRLMIKDLLQGILAYWALANRSDFLQATTANATFSAEVSSFFDAVLRVTDYEKKMPVSWRFFAVTLSLVPECFEYLQVKSQHRPASVVRKTAMIEAMAKALTSSQASDRVVAIVCYVRIARMAAAYLGVDEHPKILTDVNVKSIVAYAKSLYRPMFAVLFGAYDRQSKIDSLQSQWLTSYLFLNYDETLADMVSMIESPTTPTRYILNILRAVLNLYTLPNGLGLLEDILLTNSSSLLPLLAKLAKQIADHDRPGAPAKRRDPMVYRDLVGVFKYMFLLARAHPKLEQLILDPAVLGAPALNEVMRVCLTAADDDLRKTSARFLCDAMATKQIWSVRLPDLRADPSHFVFAVFFMAGRFAHDMALSITKSHLSDDRVAGDLATLQRLVAVRAEIIAHYHLNELTVDVDGQKGVLTQLSGHVSQVSLSTVPSVELSPQPLGQTNPASGQALNTSHSAGSLATSVGSASGTLSGSSGPNGAQPVGFSMAELAAQRQLIGSHLETAVLLCLFSNHYDICKQAIEIMRCLVAEGATVNGDSAENNMSNGYDPVWSVATNQSTYASIASAAYVGPEETQRRAVKYLQFVEQPSTAMIRTWVVVYHRWSLGNYSNFAAEPIAAIREWRSYSSLLSSLLSPLLNPSGVTKIPDNAHFKARQFLQEATVVLLEQYAYSPEIIKEVLSTDLSPLVYVHIFECIQQKLDEHVVKERPLNPRHVAMARRVTSFLLSVVQRLHAGELYVSVDVGPLVLKVLAMLRFTESDLYSLEFEVQVYELLSAIGVYKESLKLRHELRTRNEFVATLMDLLEEPSSAASAAVAASAAAAVRLNPSRQAKSSVSRDTSHEHLVRARTESLVKAVAQLLDGLRIDVPEASDGEGSDNQSTDVIRLATFQTWFEILLRLMARTKDQATRSWTIVALSNLLNANADVGLVAAISAGYHEDLSLRLAFLQIFKNILVQGTRFSTAFNEIKKYQEMVDLVVDNQSIYMTLCDICPASEVDEFSETMLNVYEAQGQQLKLVTDMVVREINQAESMIYVLRRNCVATKMLSLFAQDRGRRFLHVALGRFLANITNHPELYVFEMEPDQLKDYQEFKDSTRNFGNCLREVMGSLAEAVDILPRDFKVVCRVIHDTMTAKSPGSGDHAVSVFFFLRYICPALVNPEGLGLLEKPPTKIVRRSLLALAKTIQSMASGMNSTVPLINSIGDEKLPVVDEMKGVMSQLFHSLCQVGEKTAEEQNMEDAAKSSSSELDKTDVVALHRFLYAHWEDASHRLMMDMRVRPKKTGVAVHRDSTQSLLPNGHLSDENAELMAKCKTLSFLLRSLGRPATPKKYELGSLRMNTPKLFEFMNKNSSEVTEEFEKRLFHEGTSIDGTPVLVLTGRNFDRTTTDPNMVMTAFFRAASKMWSQRFYLFYDNTGFTVRNTLPAAARSTLDELIPKEMAQNCAGIYYYNVSSEYLPRLEPLLAHHMEGDYLNPATCRYTFLTSTNIRQHFKLSALKLDPRTERAIHDVKQEFGRVFRKVPDSQDFVEVRILLGSEYLQIHCEVPFNYIEGSPGYTNDTIRLSTIVDVYASGTTGNPNEFTIELPGQNNVVFIERVVSGSALTSSSRHPIVKAIRAAKNMLTKLEASELDLNRTTVKVEQAMCTLLNMALANLNAPDSDVQLAAYNLLATLPARYDLDFGREVHGGANLALPKNEASMAVSFSEAVAQSQPELTVEFLTEFFVAFDRLSEERAQDAILYAIPWLKNLHRHVVVADPVAGQEKAASIIHKCLDITISNKHMYNCVILNLWPVLCLDEGLSDIMLDEIIKYIVVRLKPGDTLGKGLDMRANGKDQQLSVGQVNDIMAIVTSFPTIPICGTILTRIRSVLNKPMDASERLLVNHPKFCEIAVMVRMLSVLTFESVLIAETFLPEIILVVTTFLHVGPLKFRQSLHSLLVNVVHAFASSHTLPAERRKHVENILNELCAADKGREMFGLDENIVTSEDDVFGISVDASPSQPPVHIAAIHVEHCCNLLLDVITSVASAEESGAWRVRWTAFAMQFCFTDVPVLQWRSFLVLGCLSKLDVQELVLCRVIQVFRRSLMAGPSDYRDDYGASTLFCLTKMLEGTSKPSVYHGRLFWLALCTLASRSSVIFNSGLVLLTTCMKSLDDYGVFEEVPISTYFLEARKPFDGEWQAIEQLTQVTFSERSFHLALSGRIARGLEKGRTRPATIKALQAIMRISAKRDHMHSNPQTQLKVNPPPHLCYFYLLFLNCATSKAVQDLVWAAGYSEDALDGKIKRNGVAMAAPPPAPVSVPTAATNPAPGTSVDGSVAHPSARPSAIAQTSRTNVIEPVRIPDVLVEWLAGSSAEAGLLLYLGTHLFRTETENVNGRSELMDIRYMESIRSLAGVDRTRKGQLLSQIYNKLKLVMREDDNVALVKLVLAELGEGDLAGLEVSAINMSTRILLANLMSDYGLLGFESASSFSTPLLGQRMQYVERVTAMLDVISAVAE